MVSNSGTMPTGQYGSVTGGVQQTRLLEQQRRLQHVATPTGTSDDVVRDRVRARTHRRPAAAAITMSSSLRASSDNSAPVTDERPAGAEFGDQQRDPVRFGQRRVVGLHTGPGQQLGDHLLVHVGVLPHVQAGQVETEDVARLPAAGPAGRRRAARCRWLRSEASTVSRSASSSAGVP